MQYVFLKNKIIEETKARIPLSTHALQYGTGVFDSIRGYWNEEEKSIYLLRPREHFKRLLNSAKIFGWRMPYTEEDLLQELKKLIRKNKPTTDVYVRPFIFQATSKLTPIVDQSYEPTMAMYMISLGNYLPVDKGLKGKVSSWFRVEDSMIPPRGKVCGLYINSALARAEAEKCGADEAIFLNQNGSVCEGSGENLFIVREGMLVTPPVSSNILEGITRLCVIVIARDLGISFIERDIDRSELYIADEVFLTGTACQIAYFSEIDGRAVGAGKIGSITKKIQKVYFDITRGKLPSYKEWLVRV